jgi:hypothetical protein
LAKRFQRRFSKIGISETRIACGGHIFHPDPLANMAATGNSCLRLADF